MVSEKLVDFSKQKEAIKTDVENKISNNLYEIKLHKIFRENKFEIDDLELIITSIENKLRKIEMIYFTYFSSEYDSSIIVNNVMAMSSVEGIATNKIIETKFDFGDSILKNRVDINTPILYKEIINTKFQSLILSVASLYEVLVKLCETLLKKIVIHIGDKASSVRLDNFVLYWDILVELDYKKEDEFYKWRSNHRSFINKYLNQINVLRNRFIHGYSINLEINTNHKEYMVKNYDTGKFKSKSSEMITELILDNFTENILLNTRKLTTEILDLFVKKLSRSRMIPM